jgi:hypothetical protein
MSLDEFSELSPQARDKIVNLSQKISPYQERLRLLNHEMYILPLEFSDLYSACTDLFDAMALEKRGDISDYGMASNILEHAKEIRAGLLEASNNVEADIKTLKESME